MNDKAQSRTTDLRSEGQRALDRLLTMPPSEELKAWCIAVFNTPLPTVEWTELDEHGR